MKKLSLIGGSVISLTLAGQVCAQGNIAGTPVAGTARTSVAATCPSGKVIPAGTPIPDAYVNDPQAYFCGSAANTSTSTSSLNPALQSAAYNLGYALGQWLFGGNNKAAAAQQQAYLAELERQRQEAERQRILAEQQRRQAMFDRLSHELMGISTGPQLQLMGINKGPDLQLMGISESPDLQLMGIGASPALQPTRSDSLSPASSSTASGSKANLGNNNSSNSLDAAGCGPTGIPGLPGVYLNTCGTMQTSAFLSNGSPMQVAQTAQSLSGPEQAAVQDSALGLAEADPKLTAPSQDPRVTNFQELDADYQKAQLAQTQAAQTLQQAQEQNEAAQAAVNLARSEITEHQGAGLTPPPILQHAFDDLNSVSKTDEEAAVRARQDFENASSNLAMTRTKAVDALLAMAPPSDASVVDLRNKQQPMVVSPDVTKSSNPRIGSPITAGSSSAIAGRRTAGELCTEIAGLQRALRRLTQAEGMQTTDQKDWLALMDDATRDAGKQAADFVSDSSTRWVTHYLEKRMQETVIKRASDGNDMAKRKELDAEFKTLWDAKKTLEKAQSQREQISGYDPFDAQKWKSLRARDLEDWLDTLKDALDKALARPEVQQALKLSDDGVRVISLSKSIIDSGYDISREIVSIKQIEILNQNAGQYLAAVNRLKKKMEDTVSNPSYEGSCAASALNAPSDLTGGQ